MIEDKFTFYKENVKKFLGLYKDIYSKYYKGDFEGRGKYNTIERDAKPFTDGYFTLAVMGNTSAGKSTFINALLGEIELLPTDFRQTTCVLTEIVYGEKLDIEITFGDNKVKHLSDATALRNLVAIPEEFDNYPVNTLNAWILDGQNERDVLKKRNILIQEQGGMRLDDAVIKKYVKTHNKSNIPVKVVVKYPLPDNYRGWKILDTPGVNAIGGIENATKEFINSKDKDGNPNVDAIIFLKNGSESISDKPFNDFVRNTFNSLTASAKKRLFMILSHRSNEKFRENEKQIMKSTVNLFIQYGIAEDRIIAVDNICELFLTKSSTQNLDLKTIRKTTPHNGWDDKTWRTCISIINDIKEELEDAGMDPNNQIIKQVLEKLSGFKQLHSKLNDFVKQEKDTAYSNLVKSINDDIVSLIGLKRKDAELLRKALKDENSVKNALSNSKKKIEEKEEEMNRIARAIREKYTKAYITRQFSHYEREIKDKQFFPDTQYMKNKAERLILEIEDTSSDILSDISNELDEQINTDSVYFTPIDFGSILSSTREESKKFIGYYTKQEKGPKKCCSDSYNYYTVTDYDKPQYEIDEDEARTKFFQEVMLKFQNHLASYKEDLYRLIQSSMEEAIEDLKETIQAEEERHKGIVNKYKDIESKKKQIAQLDKEIDDLSKAILILKTK